jgi:hypothetical protein
MVRVSGEKPKRRHTGGLEEKEGNEPASFHFAVASRVIYQFLDRRNAVKSGVEPTFALY